MTDEPNDEPDEELERIEASITATEFFRSLEECDSKKVNNFRDLLPDTVLEIANLNGKG